MPSTEKDLRFAVGTPYGDQPIKILCPFHEEDTPSFTVFSNGAKCFGCGVYLHPEQFIEHFGVDASALPPVGTKAPRTRKTREINAFDLETRILLWHHNLRGYREPRIRWFKERGFNEASIDRYKFGHDGDNFIVPIWRGDTLVGFKRRRDPLYADPDTIKNTKYVNMAGMTNEVVRPNSSGSPLVICEGELDAYLLAQYGLDTWTTTSGSDSIAEGLSHRLEWFQRHRHTLRIYVATDMDQAGDSAFESLREVFAPIPLARLHWPSGNDISEYLCSTDVGERSSAIHDLIRRV